MKKIKIILMIIILIISFGYFYQKNSLVFVDNPKIEINTKFSYQKYLKKVRFGSLKEVKCDASKLKLNKVGKYPIIYTYHHQTYQLMIKVVDTTEPIIKEIKPLTILLKQSVDLRTGIEISDNSKQTPTLTIDSRNLNTNKVGTYRVKYCVQDQSGNQTTKTRQVQVIREIGTSKQSNTKTIYLTFDDGPSANTKKILDILAKYQIKATFFVTGNGQQYNEYIKEAFKQGHTIGLHSYSHEYAEIYSSVEAYFQDLNKLKVMVKQIIGYAPHYLRFPGGSSNKVSKEYNQGIMTVLTKKVIASGYQYYDWNCGSGDADGSNVPVETIIKNATAKEENNLLILFHDTNTKDTTVEALPTIIKYYQAKGYVFKAIDDDSFYAHQSLNN